MTGETPVRRDVGVTMARRFMYARAIEGDQSFASQSLTALCIQLDAREPLEEDDRLVLLTFLLRILESRQAINVISGNKNRRGADKRGRKGTLVVMDVLKKLHESDITVEAAWAEVAQMHSLSESMVKKYWAQWRKPVEDSINEALAVQNMQKGI